MIRETPHPVNRDGQVSARALHEQREQAAAAQNLWSDGADSYSTFAGQSVVPPQPAASGPTPPPPPPPPPPAQYTIAKYEIAPVMVPSLSGPSPVATPLSFLSPALSDGLLHPLDTGDGFFPAGVGSSSNFLNIPRVTRSDGSNQAVFAWMAVLNLTWGNFGINRPISGTLYAEVQVNIFPPVASVPFPIMGASKLPVFNFVFGTGPETKGIPMQITTVFGAQAGNFTPSGQPINFQLTANVWQQSTDPNGPLTLQVGGPDFNGGIAYLAIFPVGLR